MSNACYPASEAMSPGSARWWAVVPIALVACALARASGAEQQPSPAAVLALELLPKRIVGDEEGQLLVTVEFTGAPQTATLHVTTPRGVRADPPDVTLEKPPRRITVPVAIRGDHAPGFSDERQIVVELGLPGSSVPQPLTATTAVLYSPRLSYRAYLAVATIGVVVGYSLRLLVKVLATVPPPQAAPVGEGSSPPGALTRFVQAHYYAVDVGVTLALGFIALLYLGSTGRAPDVATHWPGAFTLGVGLGGLSNSELFSRLGKP